MKEKTMVNSFGELLTTLNNTEAGEKLALMAGQVKVEKEVLSEIMFRGNRKFPDLDFYLEEKRRDLTIRSRQKGGEGILLDWVEAKMCYSDCLARNFLGTAEPDEYLEVMKKDIGKQVKGLNAMPERDRGARLTSMLIVLHYEQIVWRHKYYPCFLNRRGYDAKKIEDEAEEYVTNMPTRLGRALKEHVSLQLFAGCRLQVFVFF
jgi:hypothetical protein